jgi:hypothetical protein
LSASGKGFFVPIPFWDEQPGSRTDSQGLPRFFFGQELKKTALRNYTPRLKIFSALRIPARSANRTQPKIFSKKH